MSGWRIAANLATLGNGLLGVGAILYILLGNPLFAMLLIAIGVGFDGLDGLLARRARSPPSSFGRIADSIADALTFGVAPALLIAVHTGQGAPWAALALAGAFVGALYLALAIGRLTYFTARGYRRRDFLGVPTPMSALAVIWIATAFYVPAYFTVQPWLFFGFAIVLALLMIAPWEYPKIRAGSPLRIPMAVTGIAAAVVLVPFQFRPGVTSWPYLLAFGAAAVLACGLLLYYVVGPWTVASAPQRRPAPPPVA
ncbi:MAG: CDP-alcohol phosphatidyltransferase family protein [Thermoplasmata archaeon]